MGNKIGSIEYSRLFTNNKLIKCCMQIRSRYRVSAEILFSLRMTMSVINCERVRSQFNTRKPGYQGVF